MLYTKFEARLNLKLIVIMAICSAALLPLYSNNLVRETVIPLEYNRYLYKIDSSPIINLSESVWADSILLVKDTDYLIDYQRAELLLSIIPDVNILRVEYILIPPILNYKLQNWEAKPRSDSLYTAIQRRQSIGFNTDARLDIQGVKTFAITFSDNESFDLKQSLFVNLSGELAPGVSISAQLSDSQSKLSPEGDSKELSSLDRVFIKVYGKKFELAMGDLELKWSKSRYMEYYSKFEGINMQYSDKHSVQAAYSAGSGKSASINLSIVDGKQGPYYLRANDYQPGFIVIAGSEEVFVDGSLWERGVDYTIDYAEGSVMFKRLISSSNSVLVRFHYSDEYYPISNYLNSTEIKLRDKLSFRHHFIWQEDDKNNPLLFSFTDSDLDSLRAAGDNRAWGEGISQVSPGSGSYRKETSLTGVEYYVYAYPDSTAIYNISFSFVGSGNGDYVEFSSGKFRYVGSGMGAWIPRKQLIAPTRMGNLNLAVDYLGTGLQTGFEAVGSLKDKNTLSEIDDEDNRGGIVYSYAKLPIKDVSLDINHEMRSANSYLFGKYRNPELEYDLSGIEYADSLKQSETNVGISHKSNILNASTQLRYKDISNLYNQKAVRILSSSYGKGYIPALNIRTTVSQQHYDDNSKANSLLQYYQANAAWNIKLIRLQMDWLMNKLESDNTGSMFERLMPSLRIGSSSSTFTQLSFSNDVAKIKNTNWIKTTDNQTYALRQMYSTQLHNVDIDYTHRELSQPASLTSAKSRYDLVNLRTSHTAVKRAISMFLNYQLNQTEFFPKIRELQYLGNGIGYYDSTGVSVVNGDYDYVFVNAGTGTLSTEINALWSVYIKPATISNNEFFKRWHGDVNISLSEQSANRNNWRSYLFIPGEVFNESNTIYGRQAMQSNLWLDIIRNRITGIIQINTDRSLDKRYQSAEKSSSALQAVQLDIKGYSPYNTRLQISNDRNRDSRYMSETTIRAFSVVVQRNFTTTSNLQTELSFKQESGGKQDGSENYALKSYAFSPTFKSVWMQKYRISSGFSVQYNSLDGSSYFGFLPQKRDGWIIGTSSSGMYRINNFSSLSLEYRFTDYPKEKGRHELKLEFKAEL